VPFHGDFLVFFSFYQVTFYLVFDFFKTVKKLDPMALVCTLTWLVNPAAARLVEGLFESSHTSFEAAFEALIIRQWN